MAVTGSPGTTTYTLTAHRLAQEAYVKATNTGTGNSLDYSVALSGSTMAGGALSESSNAQAINPGAGAEADNSASSAGVVYVFQ